VGGKKMSREQTKALDQDALRKLENLQKRSTGSGDGSAGDGDGGPVQGAGNGGTYPHVSVACMTR
jgi:glutamate synthase domain-containing protein 1